MTYTFKLARRLAVSRNYGMISALVLIVAACAGDNATEPTGVTDAQWRDRTAVEVSVSPNTLTIETNQVARFSGRVHSPSVDSIDTAIEWSANGGTITPDGLFSSAQAGTFKVVGRGRQKTDTATVTVVQPQATLASLAVSPASVSLATGASQQFGVTAQLSDGSTATVGTVWTATGGTVDANGLYTAGSTAGTYQVVVANTAGTVADTALVTVTAPAQAPAPTPAPDTTTTPAPAPAPAPAPDPTLSQVILSPASASLLTGATKQFAAYGRMSNGDSVAVAVTYASTGGTVSSAGLYAAGTTAGTYRVIAKAASGPADTAVVTLTAPAPTLSQVVLTPTTVAVSTGGTKQFTPYARMSNGDSVSVAVSYAATGGTITSGGLYTAGSTAGAFRVIATASGHADTTAVTISAPVAPSAFAGIPVGPFHLPAANGGATYSGTLRVIYLPTLKASLDSARARKMRVVLAMPRSNMRNADNTFNLTMWRAEVDRYKTFDFQPYLNDGTLLGLYMIDEPDCGGCWGGQTISQATVDGLAQYVKAIWPNMTTFARVTPGWFKSYGAPRYLDVAWAQWEGPHYPSANMTPEQFRDKNVADAKAMGLGLVLGLNTLDGGDGSSGITGTFQNSTASTVNRWQMSAAELERVGSVFAASTYNCAILSWRWSSDYPTASYLSSAQLSAIRGFDGRSDVQAAWAKVTQAAAGRAMTSCRVK